MSTIGSKKQYARGTYAKAECQRSGQKMNYRELVEDGHIEGLLVHPDWWEPKHPQEIPVEVTDPVALFRPSPEISIEADYGLTDGGGLEACQTEPNLLHPPTGTIAEALSGGERMIVIDVARKYIFGECVFVALDGGGWFASKIRTEANAPSFTVPFNSEFSGAATAGNDYYIGYVYDESFDDSFSEDFD
jgi:hypothetical protein